MQSLWVHGDGDNDGESSGGGSSSSVGGECKCIITIPSSGEDLRQSLVFPTVSCTCPLISGS